MSDSTLDTAIAKIEAMRAEHRRAATSWKIGFSLEERAADYVYHDVLLALHELRNGGPVSNPDELVPPPWAYAVMSQSTSSDKEHS
jgi:hypothetical protein